MGKLTDAEQAELEWLQAKYGTFPPPTDDGLTAQEREERAIRDRLRAKSEGGNKIDTGNVVPMRPPRK